MLLLANYGCIVENFVLFWFGSISFSFHAFSFTAMETKCTLGNYWLPRQASVNDWGKHLIKKMLFLVEIFLWS